MTPDQCDHIVKSILSSIPYTAPEARAAMLYDKLAPFVGKTTLRRAFVLTQLVALRKRIAREGDWTDENLALFSDTARELGFSPVDTAYIAGDLDELYRLTCEKEAQP